MGARAQSMGLCTRSVVMPTRNVGAHTLDAVTSTRSPVARTRDLVAPASNQVMPAQALKSTCRPGYWSVSNGVVTVLVELVVLNALGLGRLRLGTRRGQCVPPISSRYSSI
jgi:hypothetical protein